jgi:hypothetical protein
MTLGDILIVVSAVVVVVTPVVVLVVRKTVEAVIDKAVAHQFKRWEVRFTKLHERRVEVMEGLIDRLVALRNALDDASGIQPLGDPHGLESLQRATGAGREADRFFAARRYYLPEDTADCVAKAIATMKKGWADLSTGQEGHARGQRDAAYGALVSSGFRVIREQLPPAIAEVEGAFRRLVEEG